MLRTKTEVHLTGWGAQYDNECTTGEHGPDPHARCKFPFTFQNKIVGPINNCYSGPTPSSLLPICKAVKRHLSKRIDKQFPPKGYHRVRIY